MSLDDLLAALGRDAEARAAAILEQARRDAASIDDETEAEVNRRRRAHLARFETEERARTAREVADARREAAGVIAQARRGFLRRLFEAVRADLPATAAGPRYRAALPDHLDEALSYVRPAPAIVRAPPFLAETIERALASVRDVRVETDTATAPGVIVEATDGSVTVDNTLESRLSRLESDLAIEVLRGVS